MRLPRVVVAAPSTGQGKTTIATGLMAALRASGRVVSGHKAGPDYIDPGYHALATGRPGRNLDPHLVGEDRIAPLLLHGARGADVAMVEGVMGLYDGRLGTDGFASTAHVATLTHTPVLLVLDVARMSRSAAAIAAGMATFDPDVRIGGVVLNRARPGRNTDEITRALERIGLPVLGALPLDETLAAPSRHLGLVPAEERDGSVAMIERLGEQVAAHLDVDAILDLARSAPDLDAVAWDPAAEIATCAGADGPAGVPTRPEAAAAVVAMAGGRAFTFRYPETEELLRAAGCEIVTFDPLTDRSLPEGTSGIYLGGGFPEMYAAELAANTELLADLREAVADGVPTVAECAGLLYLAQSLDGVPMAGALPASAVMTERLTLRYPVVTAAADSLLTRAGEQVTGHEFHRTVTSPTGLTDRSVRPAQAALVAAWEVDGERVGYAGPTLHASYLHVHWAGHPQLAARFAESVHASAPVGPAGRRSSAGRDTVGRPAGLDTPAAVPDPLRHHGDVETGDGLLDFAVNVFTGPRPAWLDKALHSALDDTAYPDQTQARLAVAEHHGRPLESVLPTAGAAEAFTLLARARAWRRPVVVHPQFTEPHAALEQAGHRVTTVPCCAAYGFALDPVAVPDDADLVVIGNPTNPTGILHPADTVRALRREGRTVVVDEAFMDAVPGETESLVRERLDGLLVIRSLTKHWSIPGVRAGYVVGDPDLVARLAVVQTPWSVSGTAIAAMLACTGPEAAVEASARAEQIAAWRATLEAGLADRDIPYVPSAAPFVLARLGAGGREALRAEGIAVRRADTFPGLDATRARIAVRPEPMTARLLAALDRCRP